MNIIASIGDAAVIKRKLERLDERAETTPQASVRSRAPRRQRNCWTVGNQPDSTAPIVMHGLEAGLTSGTVRLIDQAIVRIRQHPAGAVGTCVYLNLEVRGGHVPQSFLLTAV